VADLAGSGTIVLKPTARLFGNVRSLHLVVEAGAVFVGLAKVGKSAT